MTARIRRISRPSCPTPFPPVFVPPPIAPVNARCTAVLVPRSSSSLPSPKETHFMISGRWRSFAAVGAALTLGAMAQRASAQGTITGRVTGRDNGRPLADARVLIPGTSAAGVDERGRAVHAAERGRRQRAAAGAAGGISVGKEDGGVDEWRNGNGRFCPRRGGGAARGSGDDGHGPTAESGARKRGLHPGRRRQEGGADGGQQHQPTCSWQRARA